MVKDRSFLANYMQWLLSQYQTYKKMQGADTTYRLVSINENTTPYKLTIQVIGKATTFVATADEILSDDTLVEYFSSKDIRTITYYATKALTQPKRKIVLQRFCEKLNQIIFNVKDSEKTAIQEKTAQEISLDKELINHLSPEDAHLVGYASGNNQQASEKSQMDALKKACNAHKENNLG